MFARRQGAGVNTEDPSRIAWDSQVRAAAESRGARILLVLGIVVHVYMLAIEISHGAYYHIAPVIFSLVLMAVSGAALVARGLTVCLLSWWHGGARLRLAWPIYWCSL